MAETHEEMVERVGANIAPRITPDQIQAKIADAAFHRLTPTLTVCVLTLANGFTVTGESACASPENYNQEIGEKIARAQAVEKIWPLEGYLLREKLALAANGSPPSAIGQEAYIGTKLVYGVPMTRLAWCTLRGWTVPADENGDDLGMMVEYADGIGKPNVEGYRGYVSWSPLDVFEASYQRVG